MNEQSVFHLFFSENFSSARPVDSLLNKWSSRLPDPRLHPINVWDDFVTNRYCSLSSLSLLYGSES